MLMIEDEIPRRLNELSGRHLCIGCLAEVSAAEYFGNDFMCLACAERSEHFPLASTPGATPDGRGNGTTGGGPE